MRTDAARSPVQSLTTNSNQLSNYDKRKNLKIKFSSTKDKMKDIFSQAINLGKTCMIYSDWPIAGVVLKKMFNVDFLGV